MALLRYRKGVLAKIIPVVCSDEIKSGMESPDYRSMIE